MKKLLLGLLLLLLPFGVNAETILDNYVVDIKVKDYKVDVTEEFNVIQVENKEDNFTKEFFGSQRLDEHNMNRCYIIEEEEDHPILVGTIFQNNTHKFLVHSTLNEYTGVAYAFYPPEDTIINHLTFRVEANDEIETLEVNPFQANTYNISKDGNIIIGELINNTGYLGFEVKAIHKYIEPDYGSYYETEENLLQTGSTKSILFSGISLFLTIVLGLILLKILKTDNKKILLYYALFIIALVVMQYVIAQPYMVFLMLFYGLFYFMFYSKGFKGNTIEELFVYAFLAFHSYFFFGLAVGIIPHIINNICLFISARLFRKHFYYNN